MTARGYDAVLLDQRMPGLDGLETLRQIKQRAPDACVVMVTAYASIELAVDAMRLGATDFLRKPMTPETLRSATAAALARTPIRPPAHGAVSLAAIVRHRRRDDERISDPPSADAPRRRPPSTCFA